LSSVTRLTNRFLPIGSADALTTTAGVLPESARATERARVTLCGCALESVTV